MSDSTANCRNLYSFVRLRVGKKISDREIARRWPMEWKSFSALRHGRRQVPRIADLETLARMLGVEAAFVFEVARGVPAAKVHRQLEQNDPEKLSEILIAGVQAGHRDWESKERRLDAVLERIDDAVFTIDIQGRFQDVNRRLCELSGLSRTELLEGSLFDLLSAQQRPELVATAAAIYRSREACSTTLTVRIQDGSERVLETVFTRIDDVEGNAIGIQGTARDATERRRVEEELRRQHATLSRTFEAMPAAAILFAKDGTILLANRLVENVCEYSAAEILGRNASEVFGNPGPIACPVTRAFQTGRFEQQISSMKNKSGAQVQVHRTAGPVLTEARGGAVESVVEVLVDVTDHVASGDPNILALLAQRNGTGEGLSKRRFVRVPLEAAVRYKTARASGTGAAANLGRGGIVVEVDRPIPVASRIRLEWQLPGQRQILCAFGKVVWIQSVGIPLRASASAAPRSNARQASSKIGICFQEIPAPSRAAIVRFVLASTDRIETAIEAESGRRENASGALRDKAPRRRGSIVSDREPRAGGARRRSRGRAARRS